MNITDLTYESAWIAKFNGDEQYAYIPFTEGPLAGETLMMMVLRERAPFTQLDREHAQRRVEGLKQHLLPGVTRMMLHLGINDPSSFFTQYTAPTIMLTAGDFSNWSLSFEPRIPTQPSGGIFCEWRNDEINEVWVAD